MKGQDHTFYELTTDPWIILLAILIGLVVLFFVCATRVQANLPDAASFDANAKRIETLPLEHQMPGNHLKRWTWYGDFSDISNERAGNSLESKNTGTLKGNVHIEGKRSLPANMLEILKALFGLDSSDHSSDSPPAFVSP